jgi:hypothetical protein
MSRPRTVSFEENEMIALGIEMVDWVMKNEPLHLSHWYTIHKGFIYNEWKTFLKRPEFVPYYEKALKLIGMQYLDGKSRVKEGISQRWLRVYFKDLREDEDETAAYNASLRKEVANQEALNLVTLAKMAAEGQISQKKTPVKSKK